MYCTFYRPTEVNTTEFENIIGKLAYDLHRLKTEQHDEWSVYRYFYDLSRHAAALENNPAMKFLGLAAPRSMPSDCCVAYFYYPTYLATAFMIKSVMLYPSLMNDEIFLDSELDFDTEIVKNTLAACLLACTGREFEGAGILPMKDCVKIFAEAGAGEFIEKYPDLCPEFTVMYREKKAFVDSGAITKSEAWYNQIQ